MTPNPTEPGREREIRERAAAVEKERQANIVLKEVGRDSDFIISAYAKQQSHARADIAHLLGTIDALTTKLAAAEETLAELRDAAEEYRTIVAGWFDFSDTDAYDELNAALVHADRATHD